MHSAILYLCIKLRQVYRMVVVDVQPVKRGHNPMKISIYTILAVQPVKNGHNPLKIHIGRTLKLLLQNLPFILLLLTSLFTFPISDFFPYYLSNFLFRFCLFCSKSSWTATKKFCYKSWKLLCMSKIAYFFYDYEHP